MKVLNERTFIKMVITGILKALFLEAENDYEFHFHVYKFGKPYLIPLVPKFYEVCDIR